MKMALPAFIPTLQSHSTRNYTRVDNVFCTEGVLDNIMKCNTGDEPRLPKTDHFPIITEIDVQAEKTQWEPRPNFRMADWNELTKILKHLANIPPPTEIGLIKEFDTKLKALNDAIGDAVGKTVKLTKLSPYEKRWWTMELTGAKKKMRQLGAKSKYHRLNRHHPIHEEYCQQ
jgi:hypothetical protein